MRRADARLSQNKTKHIKLGTAYPAVVAALDAECSRRDRCIKLAGANQACIIYFAKMAAAAADYEVEGTGFVRRVFTLVRVKELRRAGKNQIASMTGSETAREEKCIDSDRCEQFACSFHL